MKWHFSRKRPSDKTRDPVAGEFFALDAIKNAGEALVREGIQNSLDARIKPGKALVRIYSSGETGALPAARLDQWFGTAWHHLEAPKNGLRPESVSRLEPCRFLVFEDFGTTGLIGDPDQFEPEDGSNNAFFYFFRAEGKTQKAGDDRGRWGIGKQVFPRSSKAQAFFGYTETDQGEMLMGGCILKHHCVEGAWYKPDGFFGESRQVSGDEFTTPIRDRAVLDTFRSDFNLRREAGQHGLSVVVPWLDDGLDDPKMGSAFDRKTLVLAVLDGYFVPILEGRLEVEIEDSTGSDKLTRDSYRTVLDSIQSQVAGSPLAKDVQRLQANLRVAEIAANGGSINFELLACPSDRARWAETMLPESMVREMRTTLDEGGTLCVTASLTIRPKGLDEAQDRFRCYIQKDPQLALRPCHIREDLIISNVDCPKVSGFVCLVRIEGGALATLLGDAEGPAHTEWQASSRNFKDKYVYGGMTITFVSQFPNELLRRIYSASKQLDRTLLDDLFHDSRPEPIKKGKSQKQGSGATGTSSVVDPPPVIPPTRRPGHRIDEVHEGFVVRSDGDGVPPGTRLKVRAAYETAKGSPLGTYHPNDFRFTDDTITLTLEGCRAVEVENNGILLEIESAEFSAKATGFDVNRDLYVKADAVRAKSVEAQEDEQVTSGKVA